MHWRVCPCFRPTTSTSGVRAGVVTLSGQVSSDEGKWNAEDAFRGLQGIERVLNETRGVTQAPGQPPQAEMGLI